MIELLELRGKEKVLEVGTGTGYQAVVLSKLCAKVFSIERINEEEKITMSRDAASRYLLFSDYGHARGCPCERRKDH